MSTFCKFPGVNWLVKELFPALIWAFIGDELVLPGLRKSCQFISAEHLAFGLQTVCKDQYKR